MDLEQIDKILRHTLSDAKMSRGEKRVLKQIVEESGADEADLAVFRSRAFDIAREQLENHSDRATIDWLEDAVRVLSALPPSDGPRPSEAYFTPGSDGPTKIAGLIVFARKTIDICVFTITDDRVSDAIYEAHQQGTKIRIISDNDKAFDPGSDIERLQRRGIDVRVDTNEYHMHHKFAVFDNATTLTGSYNWTRSAAERNAENFIISYDCKLANRFTTEFNRLWNEFG